jgi:hypothetical protein
MKHVLFYILIIALCACNTKGQQSLNSSVAESTCVIKLKNLQNGYNVSFIREEDGCTIKFCKGDSVNLYIETARLPRCLSEYDSVYGKYTVDFDIPIVKLDTLDINKYNIADVFFMDVNFDGKEDFIYTELGNGKLLYECYDIENVVIEGKKPKLIKSLEEEPYNMFASGAVTTIEDCVVFDHQKKEIFIYTTSGCCIYYNTWAKLTQGGLHGDKPCVKVVKEERHSFQKEGDGGIETVETYVLKNDSLELVGRKEISF